MSIAARTLVLWAVLVVLFAGIYFGLLKDGGAELAAWWAPALIIVGVVLVVVVVVLVIRARAGIHLNNEGVALMTQGRYAAALQAFERARPKLNSSALIQMNLGVANQMLWRLDASETWFQGSAKATGAGHLRIIALPQVALTQALLGKLEGARGTLEQARQLKNDLSGGALLAQAVISCREGKWEDALAHLERGELRTLGGTQRGLADALRAWCVERTLGQLRHVDLTALYGETGPDAIRAHWPELVAFLDRAPRA